MTTTTHYAAIDSTDPLTGAVYGVGSTEAAALAQAAEYGAESCAVAPCTAEAAAYVNEHGGAPSARLEVSRRGVSLAATADDEQTTECAYCGHDVTAQDPEESAPPARDSAAWAQAAKEHAKNCEWVQTRAFRIYPKIVAQEVGARRPDLSGVAETLMKNPTLTADEVIAILDEAAADHARDVAHDAAAEGR